MARGRAANDVQTAVRMPRELYERLQEAAGDRPLGEEIRRRLEASLGGAAPSPDSQVFSDVLRALGEAASTAAKTQHDGGFDPYAAFEAAVMPLLQLLRPAGSTGPEAWQGIAIAAETLQAIGRPDLLPRLMEIVQRHGEQRP